MAPESVQDRNSQRLFSASDLFVTPPGRQYNLGFSDTSLIARLQRLEDTYEKAERQQREPGSSPSPQMPGAWVHDIAAEQPAADDAPPSQDKPQRQRLIDEIVKTLKRLVKSSPDPPPAVLTNSTPSSQPSWSSFMSTPEFNVAGLGTLGLHNNTEPRYEIRRGPYTLAGMPIDCSGEWSRNVNAAIRAKTRSAESTPRTGSPPRHNPNSANFDFRDTQMSVPTRRRRSSSSASTTGSSRVFSISRTAVISSSRTSTAPPSHCSPPQSPQGPVRGSRPSTVVSEILPPRRDAVLSVVPQKNPLPRWKRAWKEMRWISEDGDPISAGYDLRPTNRCSETWYRAEPVSPGSISSATIAVSPPSSQRVSMGGLSSSSLPSSRTAMSRASLRTAVPTTSSLSVASRKLYDDDVYSAKSSTFRAGSDTSRKSPSVQSRVSPVHPSPVRSPLSPLAASRRTRALPVLVELPD
ncbi:hypothetical protein FISHEDRAFT_73790 [Fistulina hepatica ATCC 64428]|uniref:Uncharacterized protein n=1 Tax=Fistulina hepatica ATCC 64428 TaxID=1128425 RepID=A0A0D7AB42_9AGAR|nr:hypothetical protein FISHEDRAFT_73790 [Fistulina hepatica ATCC 64428]